MSAKNKSVNPDKLLVGQRVRRTRESHDYTREQFSEKINISPQFLAEIENGTKGMSIETLSRICLYYGSADYILFGRENIDTDTPAAKTFKELTETHSEEVTTILESLLDMVKKAHKDSTD